MSKPNFIELPGVPPIPILYEDRSVLAIDKPRGWMLVPVSWQKTQRNLQAAINSSIAAGDFWARSRNLKSLKYVHRLDADTSGVMLFARSHGALEAYSALFESRRMEKIYLAVVHGTPKAHEWICDLKIGPDSRQVGKMKIDPGGKEAETWFKVAKSTSEKAASGNLDAVTLIEARPLTGRTHQIRVHLAAGGYPIVGDELYGRAGDKQKLGLRAVSLAYVDPFTRRRVLIKAATDEFLRESGFSTEG
ncbi:MAG TPA: RluA family pseudouridine synthase [Verrucomicrobiota bacterium]|nr:RluA family pseudouridine synthase [Verrucomicrobiota bacterium]